VKLFGRCYLIAVAVKRALYYSQLAHVDRDHECPFSQINPDIFYFLETFVVLTCYRFRLHALSFHSSLTLALRLRFVHIDSSSVFVRVARVMHGLQVQTQHNTYLYVL